MVVQDKIEGTSSVSIAMGGDRMGLDVAPQSVTAVQLRETYSSGDEHAPKARKPYTITKQRERWTEEEHKKFLEALKLYGRAWRHIEEHVGSKTAVQIRSHAQKFFSKVARESSSSSAISLKPIEIPPPRPKKKPVHPYPRKVLHSIKKQTLVPERPERSSSPTSVLSASTVPNLLNGSPVPSATHLKLISLLPTEKESGYPSSTSLAEEENGSSSSIVATSSPTQEDQSSMKSDMGSKDDASREERLAVEVPTVSLKLFGRTVLVTDSHRQSCSPVGICKSLASETWQENFGTNEGKPMETSAQNLIQNDYVTGSRTACSPWPCGGPSALCYMQFHKEDQNPVEVSAAPLTWWGSFGALPFPFLASPSQNPVQMPQDTHLEVAEEREIQIKEGSWTGSNTSSLGEEVAMANKNRDIIDSQSQEPSGKKVDPAFLFKPSATSAFSRLKASPENCMKGFVPYKRRLAERDASEIVEEESEGQRIRLCL